MMTKTLSVSAIQQGTVIDHITAGKALKIIHLLNLDIHSHQVTIGLNLKSSSIGLKDLIKIENLFLSEIQASQIAIFSPQASVNVIENFEVIKKFKVRMPKEIVKILCCPNNRCICNSESIPTSFFVDTDVDQIFLRCKYCEQNFFREVPF